jgi:protein-S-isoprenylcysteine O-methyltransferase Ste14
MGRNWENWVWIIPMMILVALAPSPHDSFSSRAVDAGVDACGALLVCLGVWIRICARGWKHEHGNGKRQLVTTGAYGFVRHPLYLGTLLCGLGICAIHGSPIILAGFLVWSGLGFALVIRREERVLAEKWPDACCAYRRSVPLLIARPGQILKLVRRVPADLRKTIVMEADAIFLWPMAGILVRLWEVAGRPPGRIHDGPEMTTLLLLALAMGAEWLVVKHGPDAERRLRSEAPGS